MVYDPNNLPDDITQLKAIIVSQAEAYNKLLESSGVNLKTTESLVAEISRLNVTIQKLTEMLFGKKSEKLPKDKPRRESESVETSNEEISDATKSRETPENPVPKNFTGTPRKKKKKKKNGGAKDRRSFGTAVRPDLR